MSTRKYYPSGRLVPLYAAVCLIAIALSLTWVAKQDSPANSWRSLLDTVQSYNATFLPFSSSTSTSSKCPAHCPSDPFVQPGMIHFPLDPKNYNETRWIPFPQYSRSERSDLGLKELPKEDEIPQDVWEGVAPDWTAQLGNGGGVAGDASWDWLRDRYILFVDDRNNIQQLCEEIHGVYNNFGGHTGGYCRLERLNTIIANWFLLGMVDDESFDWFRPNEGRPITFEGRIKQLMLPKMAQDGYDRMPDLIVISSLFWDEALLRAYDKQFVHRKRPERTGFFYNEIEWHRSRFRALVNYMRDLYGQTIPLMFRTRHIRMNIANGEALEIFQFDQGCRAISKEMGVRLFTWGGKLEGYAPYYDNDQHFPLGPNTYIFGDMTFFYLRRTILPCCWECHQWDD